MMETNDLRYNIIWIDDDCDKYEEFILNALGEGIKIEAFKYGKKGIEALCDRIEAWDGVILDVKCLYDENDKLADAEKFYKVREELLDIKREKRSDIPYFVYSAQPDLIGNELFKASLNGRKLYNKGKDQDALLKDIKIEAEKLPETQIRHKYLSFISDDRFQEIEPTLIKILTAVENNETNNADVIMVCRQVLHSVMAHLEAVGILPLNSFNNTNLAECSRFLGDDKLKEYVPIYIQRSLHSCVVVSNGGSHSGVVRNAITKGEAPFLIRSTVFELLNILSWCATLSTKPEDVEKMRADISNISMKFKAKKDENGDCPVGDHLVPDSQEKSASLQEGTPARLSGNELNDHDGDDSTCKGVSDSKIG